MPTTFVFRRPTALSVELGLLLAVLVLAGGMATPVSALDYKRDIMPIFRKKCYDCHEGAEGKSKGGLKLDDPADFFGRFAKNDVVVPGDWDASYLFVTITRERAAKGAMPPKDKGEPLTPDEIMTVAKWIHEGAKIDGEKGEAGPDEFDPEKLIKFKDGVMLTERLGDNPDGEPIKEEPVRKEPAPRQQDWVNTEGKKISAAFGGLEGENVILLRADGKTFKYPLSKLSPESREEIARLEKARE